MKALLDAGLHARRRAHRHRQDDRARTWPSIGPRRRSTATCCARSTTRSTPPAASRSCTGSLAPEGAVVKTAGFDADLRGPGARVRARAGRDGRARPTARSSAGDVVVIRYEGPKGGPGMREMLAITARHQGRRARNKMYATLDRRPILRRHNRPVHRPHRARGGGRRVPIAFVRDGDLIRVDIARASSIDLLVERAELEHRRDGWAAASPALYPWRAGQVHQAGALRCGGRDHRDNT